MGVIEDLEREFEAPAEELRAWLSREETVLKDGYVERHGYTIYRRVVKVNVAGEDRLVSFEDMTRTRWKRNRTARVVDWSFDPATLKYEERIEEHKNGH